MSNRMWDNTVEHAKTCVLGGKLYVYYTEQTHNNTGVVFNHIYEFQGLIANGHFLALESLDHDQKVNTSLCKLSFLFPLDISLRYFCNSLTDFCRHYGEGCL